MSATPIRDRAGGSGPRGLGEQLYQRPVQLSRTELESYNPTTQGGPAMIGRHVSMATIAVVLSFGLAACGLGPDSDMSEEQAEAVAQAVSQHVGVLGFSSGSGTASIDARASLSGGSTDRSARASIVEYEYSRTCTGGGDIQYSGTLDGDSVTNNLIYEGKLDYNNCTEPVLEKTTTITTRPVFDVTAEYAGVNDTTVDIESNISGQFDWEMDGDSGNCSMNLTTDMIWIVSETTSSVSGTTTGQICDQEVDRSFESSVSTGA